MPGITRPVGLWSRAPGPIGTPRQSGGIDHCGSKPHPKSSRISAGRHQVRLCKRYRKRLARGKHANQVVVAMARELVGCRWAMATEVPVTPVSP